MRVALLLLICGLWVNVNGATIDERVRAILTQMTTEEKIAQLLIPYNDFSQLQQLYGNTSFGVYYIYMAGGSDIKNNTIIRNEMQKFFIQNSRLHIPVAFAQEGLHSGASGGTIFPMPLGMSATWNPDLVRQAHEVIALECRIVGADRTFSPNINLYTDPRFGRYQEGWGEDPFLTAQMAVAAVSGLQGPLNESGYYNDTTGVLSVTKHFAAYGKTKAGQDGSPTDISERTLREIYLKPFKAIVDYGVGGLMPSHNEINGIPSHGNHWLLTDLLRKEWGWKGLVSSDYGDTAGLQYYNLVANVEDAACLALHAGVDNDLGAESYTTLVNATNNNKVSIESLDRAVYNSLYAKFAVGLFDNPYANPDLVKYLDNPQHRALSREVARQSIVMLKNNGNMLPLSLDSIKSQIAVISPLANDSNSQVGGYTQMGATIITPLNALQQYFSTLKPSVQVEYAQGCYVMNTSDALINEAVGIAKSADLAIIFVGDNQDTCQESWGGRTGDRADLDLPGGQLMLIDAIISTRTPVVVVLVNGRPATFGAQDENQLLSEINALLVAWRPGEEGGPAIVDVLFGNFNPSGKLISTWPWSVGQINGPTQPYYQKYRQYNGRMYTFQPHIPLFPFGFGLSYNTYAYSNLVVTPSIVTEKDTLTVTVLVENLGNFKGAEVVQLYVGDVLASVVRYERQLAGFQRVEFEPQESKKVKIELKVKELAFYDVNMKWGVEPGQFNVWVGGDSTATLESFFIVQ